MDLPKRKWHYILPPSAYDVFCDKCEGSNTYWSEYEHMIWCFDCKIDTKGTGGIFDGPIPIRAPFILGLNFDRLNLETKQIEKLNLDKIKDGQELVWDPPEVWEKYFSQKEETKRLLRGNKPPDTYGQLSQQAGSKHFKLVPAKRKRSAKAKA